MSAGMYTSKYQAFSSILHLKDPIHIDTSSETYIMALCNYAECNVNGDIPGDISVSHN
jgi:hypothetical protein